MNRKRTVIFAAALAIFAAWLIAPPVGAHAPSGAIFTTTVDGSEVNANIYAAKTDVYLDGGPGPGAPQTAAGLDDGFYYFQVTDPSGKTLLSSDPVGCRRFQVIDGIIAAYAPEGCAAPHNTGVDQDHGAVTIQLVPFADTPNPGGVYKVWVTFVQDYLPGSGKHGFVPSHTKTDNFKVGAEIEAEIDTVFFDRNTYQLLSGLSETWFDTVGASNKKWSYFVPLGNQVQAHVEAVELGTHYIAVAHQPGCTVWAVYLREGNNLRWIGAGPQTVPVTIKPQTGTVVVEVDCEP